MLGGMEIFAIQFSSFAFRPRNGAIVGSVGRKDKGLAAYHMPTRQGLFQDMIGRMGMTVGQSGQRKGMIGRIVMT